MMTPADIEQVRAVLLLANPVQNVPLLPAPRAPQWGTSVLRRAYAVWARGGTDAEIVAVLAAQDERTE